MWSRASMDPLMTRRNSWLFKAYRKHRIALLKLFCCAALLPSALFDDEGMISSNTEKEKLESTEGISLGRSR